MRFFSLLLLIITSTALASWSYYGGAPGGGHYSPLKEINTQNVHQLQKAWEYHTGDVSTKTKTKPTTFEATPIFFDNKLVFCTPYNRVIALNPGTGEKIWSFNPKIDRHAYPVEGIFVCRGVAAYTDKKRQKNETCQQRIVAGTIDGRLFEVDAKTGQACTMFGDNGFINVRRGVWAPLPLSTLALKQLGIPEKDWPIMKEVEAAQAGTTSGPAVINGKIIIGSAMDDNVMPNMPGGVVRAYNANNGKLLWTFHIIPHDMRNKTGAANVWGPISVDPKHNIVYVGTSSPSPDYDGSNRLKKIPYANALIALNASTGKPLWHYQIVHHDIYDYDLAAQPTLIDIQKNGHKIPAVVQATKMGFIFTFNRYTGKAIFPIVEKTVPRAFIASDKASTTQPYPTLPKPLIHTPITEKNAWGITPIDRWLCKRQIRHYESKGMFTPASTKGSIEFPFTGGGINWGSVAFDPHSQLMIVNYSRIANIVQLIPRNKLDPKAKLGADNTAPVFGGQYALKRTLLMSPLGVPCTPPPWGKLAAIDMRTGEVVWSVPFGSVKRFGIRSPASWGSPNTGGSMVTAGGLIFIGASIDNRFHAYNTKTGKLLWQANLPAVGAAVPMTYRYKGKQFIVIAAGGGMGTPSNMLGDSIVAYSLPN